MGRKLRITQRVSLAQQAVQMAVNELAKQNPEVRADFWRSWDFKLGTNDHEHTILCRAIFKRSCVLHDGSDTTVVTDIPVRAICKVSWPSYDLHEYGIDLDIWVGFDKNNLGLIQGENKQFIENPVVKVIKGKFLWLPFLYRINQLDESDLPLLPSENFLSF